MDELGTAGGPLANTVSMYYADRYSSAGLIRRVAEVEGGLRGVGGDLAGNATHREIPAKPG